MYIYRRSSRTEQIQKDKAAKNIYKESKEDIKMHAAIHPVGGQ